MFVIWLTDGMFPSNRSLDTRDALEEERRLFYVAITRARDELVSHLIRKCGLSGGYGDVFQRPSRFLTGNPKRPRRRLASATPLNSLVSISAKRSEVDESLAV